MGFLLQRCLHAVGIVDHFSSFNMHTRGLKILVCALTSLAYVTRRNKVFSTNIILHECTIRSQFLHWCFSLPWGVSCYVHGFFLVLSYINLLSYRTRCIATLTEIFPTLVCLLGDLKFIILSLCWSNTCQRMNGISLASLTWPWRCKVLCSVS